MEDLSEKGRESFYKRTFSEINKIKSSDASDSEKYKLMELHYNNIRIYENSRELYKKQIKLLWDLKKNHAIISKREKEYLGVISKDSQERDKQIKNSSEFLKKQSSTFEKDLEKVIKNDSEVKNIYFTGMN